MLAVQAHNELAFQAILIFIGGVMVCRAFDYRELTPVH